jgi:hypothetical protein
MSTITASRCRTGRKKIETCCGIDHLKTAEGEPATAIACERSAADRKRTRSCHFIVRQPRAWKPVIYHRGFEHRLRDPRKARTRAQRFRIHERANPHGPKSGFRHTR